MSVQTDKNKKRIIQWLVPSVALIIFILFTALNFEKSMETRIRDDVISEFQNGLSVVVHEYNEQTAITEDLCQTVMNYIGDKDISSDSEKISRVLIALESSSHVKKAYYKCINGELIGSDGKKYNAEAKTGYPADKFSGSGNIMGLPDRKEYFTYSIDSGFRHLLTE